MVWARLATSGASPRIKNKYSGILISQPKISVCGNPVDPGKYGFGLKPAPPGEDDGTFDLYNTDGDLLIECPAKKEAGGSMLGVSTTKNGSAKINIQDYLLSSPLDT